MSMICAEFGPYEMFVFLPVVYGLTLGDAQLGVGSVVRLVVGGPAHALSSPATASPTHIASRPPRRSLRMVMPSPLAGYCLHSRQGLPSPLRVGFAPCRRANTQFARHHVSDRTLVRHDPSYPGWQEWPYGCREHD